MVYKFSKFNIVCDRCRSTETFIQEIGKDKSCFSQAVSKGWTLHQNGKCTCSKCIVEYWKGHRRDYEKKHKDKLNEWHKIYSRKNRDKINKKQKEWREKNQNYSKLYYQKNKDKINENRKEYRKKYYQKNKDSILEKMRVAREKSKLLQK